MKAISRNQPLQRDDDGPEMKLAVRTIKSWGYTPLRPNQYQLKIGDLSYYPSNGTILRDGGNKLPEKGLQALRSILDSRKDNSIVLY